MWRSKGGNDISWLAVACALVAIFLAIAVYRGIPSFQDGGRDGAMRLVTYLGTFLAAMFLATISVAVMFSLNATRRTEYKTPRRDFVLASLLALFIVLAGMAKGESLGQREQGVGYYDPLPSPLPRQREH